MFLLFNLPFFGPFVRLYFTQKNLAEMMPAKPPEGDLPRMRRRVQCFHGANLLREDTIAAMLPEEVLWLETL